MQKRIVCVAVALFVLLISSAHEFWMQPTKFFYTPGEQLTLSFKVGENFTGEAVDLKKTRIEKLELHHLQKVTDLRSQVQEGAKDNISVLLAEEGTHMIVMQSNNAFITSDSVTFNAYLKEDGLDDIYYLREKTKSWGDSAQELYSRHTKLFVQVGSKTDETFKKTVGLPIEIVPDINPYAVKVGQTMRFKILFQGKPLFGAKVKVWSIHNKRTSLQNIYSQQDGVIDARISTPGTWMISVVNMVKSADPKADWQSYWGSLVFAVK
jgi:uncharacterized GH25 family protein